MMIFFIVLIVLALVSVGIYNSLVRGRNQTDEAFSTMDVYMKKRYDLVPNLVESVKGYANHEKSTLENVINARNMAMSAQNPNTKLEGENMLSGALKSLFALTENYPQLKADASFTNLQNQLETIENDIAHSRKYYNGAVKIMNNKIDMFPSNLFASAFGFKRYPFFSVEESNRQAVEVKF